MSILWSGRAEGVPYSLSRWTDLPAAKWPWFLAQIQQGWMQAFDPRSAVPKRWSLTPTDTLGMIFWTKNPENLIRDRALLRPYNLKVHLTATGWHEVERGAPSIPEAIELLSRAAAAFGSHNVTWRFSPVPLVGDVVERFRRLAAGAEEAGVNRVYLSFLQPNDRVPETRDREERLALLVSLADVARSAGIHVYLCNEDTLLRRVSELPANLSAGVCAPPEDFGQVSEGRLPSEGCGCVLAVDPFTINESCTLGCTYCYAGDVSSAPKKRNTTRRLPLLRP